MAECKVDWVESDSWRQNDVPEQLEANPLATRHLDHPKRGCGSNIPRHEMVMNQIQQKNEAKRRCRVCNQLKPIGEFSLKNRKPRRECKPCRALRGFRRREEEHQRQVAFLLRELLRLSRRGRLHTPKATGVFEELVTLCGGVDAAADTWAAQLQEAMATKAGLKSTAGGLWLVWEVLMLAKRVEWAEAAAAAVPASKRHNKAPAARDTPKDTRTAEQVDLAKLSDRELEAMVERYHRMQVADGIQGRSKAGRARGDGKG